MTYLKFHIPFFIIAAVIVFFSTVFLGLSSTSFAISPAPVIPKPSDFAAAENGDPQSQFVLGYAYMHGNGVQQNNKEASKWFLKAAEQGDPRAQYALGVLYAEGMGVTQNYKRGLHWFLKATEQYSIVQALAQYAVGRLYAEGKGVNRNYHEAKQWFHKAIDSNFSARHGIGCFYYYGLGVKADFSEAVRWWTMDTAGNSGNPYYLGKSHASGLGKSNLKAAERWWRTGAEDGDANSAFALGQLYAKGDGGLPQDFAEALFWMNLSFKNGKADDACTAHDKVEKKSFKCDKTDSACSLELAKMPFTDGKIDEVCIKAHLEAAKQLPFSAENKTYAACMTARYEAEKQSSKNRKIDEACIAARDEVEKHLTSKQRIDVTKRLRTWKPAMTRWCSAVKKFTF
ncbi:MAG: tetratricopeptide repeat protein [Alphaproteobacteria bacterium]